MTAHDDEWRDRLQALYSEQLQGIREQTLATWRTYLQAIAEVRDLKEIVTKESELRVERQGVLDEKLQKIDKRLGDQDRMLLWIRRIAIVAAGAAVAAVLVYLGTLL